MPNIEDRTKELFVEAFSSYRQSIIGDTQLKLIEAEATKKRLFNVIKKLHKENSILRKEIQRLKTDVELSCFVNPYDVTWKDFKGGL